jgi:hypothetical protein
VLRLTEGEIKKALHQKMVSASAYVEAAAPSLPCQIVTSNPYASRRTEKFHFLGLAGKRYINDMPLFHSMLAQRVIIDPIEKLRLKSWKIASEWPFVKRS